MTKLAILTLLFLSFTGQAFGWDRYGHYLAAEVAYSQLDSTSKEILFEILRQHPRFEEDFADAMPSAIRRAPPRDQEIWLLGRAAFWPDIARGLPEQEREKFNRPSWHFIDGKLVRDNAIIQGNNYVGIQPFDIEQDRLAASLNRQSLVTNVILAIDYNTHQLVSSTTSTQDKAIALCWVFHLFADLHQPLHTGSLYSPNLFTDGDRGGNRVGTESRPLHARWDSALSDEDYSDSLALVSRESQQMQSNELNSAPNDWTGWMQETREIVLSNAVYSVQMRTEILDADNAGASSFVYPLPESYVATMKNISRRQLGKAAFRTAAWLNSAIVH